jgi:hypothetical protein
MFSSPSGRVIMVVQPAILTYPTMVFYFWIAPQVLWNDHTCRSSHPEDRKLPITELKWDTRTMTDIPGNTAYWFFVFLKLVAVQPLWINFRTLPVSRMAWHTCIIPQNVCTCLCFINIYSKVLWNDLGGIVIKQRHWQTFWGIIHVDQATLRTGSCLLRS